MLVTKNYRTTLTASRKATYLYLRENFHGINIYHHIINNSYLSCRWNKAYLAILFRDEKSVILKNQKLRGFEASLISHTCLYDGHKNRSVPRGSIQQLRGYRFFPRWKHASFPYLYANGKMAIRLWGYFCRVYLEFQLTIQRKFDEEKLNVIVFSQIIIYKL